GTIVKCTFCSHIWKRERDKAAAEGRLDINDTTYQTACQKSCPTGAIVFGDLNDPESEVSKLAKSDRAVRLTNYIDTLPKEKQAEFRKKKAYTDPKVYYLTSQKWLKDMLFFKKNS
ncbi:MAG: hypothetical protein GXY14_10730, partial [Spirochaetes bacterium]|nr:hypothetical protein [Spirochaetota bacterium]